MLRSPMIALTLAVAAGLAACEPAPTGAPRMAIAAEATPTVRTVPKTQDPPAIVARTRDVVVAHAPYKQFDPTTRRYNNAIGRTPATACDAIIFLGGYLAQWPSDATARRKLDELTRWVLTLQDRTRQRWGVAAVPSTPDLPSPANAYFYAIDAAICGRAMLAHYRTTKRDIHLRAARGFGDTLLKLGREQDRAFGRAASRGGFCEYAQGVGRTLAHSCDTYVKNLLALGFLRDLSAITNEPAYLWRAQTARAFLVAGLEGGWEYADARSATACRAAPCPVRWRRVTGPHGEPDRYVFGDTLAYALAGLFAFEGPSPTVRRLYNRYASWSGADPAVVAYDGSIAWPGYVDVPARSPDPESAYYDLVTIGILAPLRRRVAPEHDRRAWAFLDRLTAQGAVPKWGVDFEARSIGITYFDLVTLATLASAALSNPPSSGN